MSEELKPCPFCGGKNVEILGRDNLWVSCNNCLASTACVETEKEAIELWNRRANNGTD